MSRIENLKKKNSPGQMVYSRTAEEKEPRRGSPFILILIFILIAGLFYSVFFSGLLDIKNIEVRGYSSPGAVQGIATEQKDKSIFSKNMFLFNRNKLKETLMGDPKIKEVEIKRYFPNKILIEITESNSSIIWNAAGDKYLIDDRGVVLAPATDEKFPEVFDAANIKTKPGERVCSPTFIKFINDISGGFQGSTGSALAKITIFDILTDVHVMAADGWTAYLDASKSADGQLKNLARVLSEARGKGERIEYIDMRLDNKIFYK